MTDNVAVLLYGSHARGDVDSLSDCDVLLISDAPQRASDWRHLFGEKVKDIAVTTYSWSEISGMAKYGSLFLQHIKTEGKPVYIGDSVSDKLCGILESIGEYKHARRDIAGFKSVIADVERSCKYSSITYECAVIATVIRHAAILGCWMLGEPDFGRITPVVKMTEKLGFNPRMADEFAGFYKYRLYADSRLSEIDEPVTSMLLFWVNNAKEIINSLEGLLYANEKH